MKRGAKNGKIPKVPGSLRRYPSIYRVRSSDPRAEKSRDLTAERLRRGVARTWLAWLAHARARWRLLSGPRLTGAPARLGARCEARTESWLLRIGPPPRSNQKRTRGSHDSAASVTQQPNDSAAR